VIETNGRKIPSEARPGGHYLSAATVDQMATIGLRGNERTFRFLRLPFCDPPALKVSRDSQVARGSYASELGQVLWGGELSACYGSSLTRLRPYALIAIQIYTKSHLVVGTKSAKCPGPILAGIWTCTSN